MAGGNDQTSDPEANRRATIRSTLIQHLEQTVDERIDRYLSIDHQPMIVAHYFSEASTQCIDLYRDGYFLGALMMSHAVNEGILKFVLERNGKQREPDDNIPADIEKLRGGAVISDECAQAMLRIYGSFRNDVHHMNPGITKVPTNDLAERNIRDLATIEREIFGVTTPDGRLKPKQPKYWDINPDGTVPVYFRLG